jgi:hypothetical protein
METEIEQTSREVNSSNPDFIEEQLDEHTKKDPVGRQLLFDCIVPIVTTLNNATFCE